MKSLDPMATMRGDRPCTRRRAERTRPNPCPPLRACARWAALAMLPLAVGCASMMEPMSDGGAVNPGSARYYDEQIRVLRDRVSGLEADIETMRSETADLARSAPAAEVTGRISRIEARIDQIDTARARDREVIVDQVVSEVEGMLRSAAPAPAPAGSGSRRSSSGEVYVVQGGDTLWGLSRRFGVEVGALLDANGMAETDILREGETIIIP